MNFCPKTRMLLEDVTNGDKLMFKAPKTGNLYEAKPEHTLLAGENIGDLQNARKFKNALANLSFDPVNARDTSGCPKCKRIVVACMRIGEAKKVFHGCVCGHQF
jgi:DNA-directed RNA polymerase subunit M/transcription elongation factor TFIIS